MLFNDFERELTAGEPWFSHQGKNYLFIEDSWETNSRHNLINKPHLLRPHINAEHNGSKRTQLFSQKRKSNGEARLIFHPKKSP